MDETTGAEGRARLLEAAGDCLAEHGIRGTTVRRIAARAGVTSGLITHHFSTKEALFIEAYRRLNDSALARMTGIRAAPGPDPLAAVERSMAAFFPETAGEVGQMRRMVAFWSLALTSADVASIQAETYDAFHAHLVALIQARPMPRDQAEEIASGLIAAADGLWLECCLNPERMTPDRAVRIARSLARAYLRGDRSAGPP